MKPDMKSRAQSHRKNRLPGGGKVLNSPLVLTPPKIHDERHPSTGGLTNAENITIIIIEQEILSLRRKIIR